MVSNEGQTIVGPYRNNIIPGSNEIRKTCYMNSTKLLNNGIVIIEYHVALPCLHMIISVM